MRVWINWKMIIMRHSDQKDIYYPKTDSMKFVSFSIFMLALFPFLLNAHTCNPHVSSIGLHVTVFESDAGGATKLTKEETLDFNSYMEIYNNTEIYFYKYFAPNACAPSCTAYDAKKFNASLMVLTNKGGKYYYNFAENLSNGDFTDLYKTESREIIIQVTDFDSVIDCEIRDAGGYYDRCRDFTEYNTCSTTKPYYCVKRDDGYYHGTLRYDTINCGCPIWGCEEKVCVEGFERNWCSGRKVVRDDCLGNDEGSQLIENCESSNLFCKETATTAYCTVFEDSTFQGCEDGTVEGQCSETIPKFCNDAHQLVDNPKACGCPDYMEFDPKTNEFVYLSCSDGTSLGFCSENKPDYCSEGGALSENPALCGCPQGFELQEKECVIEEVPFEEEAEPGESVQSEEPEAELIVAENSPSENPVEPEPDVPSPEPQMGITITETPSTDNSLLYGVIIILVVLVVYLFMKNK